MAVRMVLYDVGDVLVTVSSTHWLDRWAPRLGSSRPELTDRLGAAWAPGRTGHVTYDDIERRTAEVLDTDLDEARHLLDDMWTWYLGTWNDALGDHAASLRDHHTTAILSNSFVGAREREQDRYRLGDLFDPILYSHEEGMEKPDPALYALACDRLGAAPDEVVFVDDLEVNVAAARDLGIRAVLHRDTATTIGEIEAHLAAP